MHTRTLPRLVTAGLVLAAGLASVVAQPPKATTPDAGKAMPKDAGKDAVKDAGTASERRLVSIPTADGCELSGTYYPGTKGRESAAVMLVHKYGSDHTKDGWNTLALALKAKGYAVLAFDLRGHGGSTKIDPQFFRHNNNRAYLRSSNNVDAKRRIAASEFRNTYFPLLVNDLVAARRFLDGENDAYTCNSNTLFVVGAQEGASLATLWAISEQGRRPTTGGTIFTTTPSSSANVGDSVAGLALLAPMAKPQGQAFRYADWYDHTSNNVSANQVSLREKLPAFVIYPDGNNAAKTESKQFYDLLAKKKDKNEFSKELAVKTNVAGQEMLGKPALGVDDAIIKFFDDVQSKRRERQWVATNVASQQTYYVNLSPFGFGGP